MQTNKKQTRTIAFRLAADEYEIFDKICHRLGETKSSYLQSLIIKLNRKLQDDLDD